MPGGAHGDWQKAIWSDISSTGQPLSVEFLEPNQKGDRTAIFGDRYYVQVGRDWDPERRDTVVAIYLGSADARLPRRVPTRLDSALVIWPGGYPEALDNVDRLFAPTP